MHSFETQKTAIIMLAERRSVRSIAAELGISPTTVTKWKRRLTDRISALQQDELEDALREYQAAQLQRVRTLAEAFKRVADHLERSDNIHKDVPLYTLMIRLDKYITREISGDFSSLKAGHNRAPEAINCVDSAQAPNPTENKNVVVPVFAHSQRESLLAASSLDRSTAPELPGVHNPDIEVVPPAIAMAQTSSQELSERSLQTNRNIEVPIPIAKFRSSFRRGESVAVATAGRHNSLIEHLVARDAGSLHSHADRTNQGRKVAAPYSPGTLRLAGKPPIRLHHYLSMSCDGAPVPFRVAASAQIDTLNTSAECNSFVTLSSQCPTIRGSPVGLSSAHQTRIAIGQSASIKISKGGDDIVMSASYA